MNAPATDLVRSNPPQAQWDAPLSPQEWDERFPGILDAIALLGGPANSIIQLSRLPVGYGVMESKVESGSIFKRPGKRTITTLTYLAVALLGTTEEKQAYRRAVNTSHAQVRSEAGAKVAYNAFDPELQLWVAACLFFGFVDLNERLNGPMGREKKSEFYRLAEPLGTTLQVRPGMWPADLDAFEAYWEAGLKQTSTDGPVREYLTNLAEAKFLPPWQARFIGPVVRYFTVGLLPPRIRELMMFEWSDAQQRRFDRLMRTLGAVNRRLPRQVRQYTFLKMMKDFRARLAGGRPLV